ncbi:DNRLRE domain-containing protein [Halieaceae bacterium IMCC11814]|uniref:DNRLRE domain-containing protein n=2 Tax=Candidatus Marimicrobium litorale TaxID=2518991 RepID=A0ABT3T6N7_9GAMM|nr:DNRLRE domain-containing protein [Candidatus Marimicrobium litorale]
MVYFHRFFHGEPRKGIMVRNKAKSAAGLCGQMLTGVAGVMMGLLPALLHADSELPLDANPRPSEPDLEELISILRATPETGWVRVNANDFEDVWTPEGLLVSVDKDGSIPWDPRNIIPAWSGFAWDSRRGDLILYGGGHANYGGNEVYRWRGTTLSWERMSLPSDITSLESYPWLTVDGPDASPKASHTYDNNIYLPVVDRFLTFGGPNFGLGHAYEKEEPDGTFRVTGPYLLDPARADGNKVGGMTGSHSQWANPFLGVIGAEMWENRDVPQNMPEADFPRHFIDGSTGYTQEDGKDVVFVHAAYGVLSKYTINNVDDPAQDSWEHIGSNDTGWGQGAGAYLPTHDLFVRISPGLFSYWDLSTAGPANFNVAFVPSGPSLDDISTGDYGLGDYGMDYDPSRNRFLLWGGGGDVYALYPPPTVSPDGWEIEKLDGVVAPTPDSDLGAEWFTGVLGKWKYIAQIDAFVALQDQFSGNIWAYKPENWAEPGSDDPHVTIVDPVSKGFIIPGDDIVVTAATSNSASNITQVEFLLNGSTLDVVIEPPYTTTVNAVTQGFYTFEAIATDSNGNAFISPRVSATVADHVNNPPSVSMSAPLEGAVAYVDGRIISLSAEASDSDGTIAQVEFFLDGGSLGVVTAAPYSMPWTVQQGNHMITAAATDDTGITAFSNAIALNVTTPENLVVLQQGLGGYSGTTDTSLENFAGSQFHGDRQWLRSQEGGFNPLVRFAIFSNEGGPVPEGATITFAGLALYKSSTYDQAYSAHPLLVDWDQSEATWLESAEGMFWNEPGAGGIGSDYAASGSVEVHMDWNPGWLVLEVTDAVQSMSLGSQSNNGWQLIAGTGNPNQKSFRSSEFNAKPTLRPKLILQFTENTNLPPSVALTAPNEGTSYLAGDTITLSADAIDPDGSVTQVNFFYDSKWLGADSTAPYTLTKDAPAGGANALLTAVAIDNAYASATSESVTVNLPRPAGCY